MRLVKVTALAGGVGGAKLLVGLARTLGPDELTAVVNTGDDARVYGVHVAPDLDIVTYWLAGMADTERGWGIEGDGFTVVDALGRLGADDWFRLGDADLATCLYRSQRLAEGATLAQATDEIRRSLGVEAEILPMSNHEVRTRVVTADGRDLEFQEYFVKERAAPEVSEVRLSGLEKASPAPGVLEAIEEADRVVICPSNPYLSIAPIAALPGVREALRAHPRVIAVSPIVAGRAVKGPAGSLLANLAGESSASAVARLYADFLDLFALDTRDSGEIERVRQTGVEALSLDTLMVDHDASERLTRALLAA
ncbi:MAG: 2-phospho-L-lactate transferase [Actinobacteria bacterium]|nr:2-phospho-L-lactate transferase [Actinomycetota bacterium]